MNKRAILYTRVSTDPQEKRYSHETQLEACRNYAERLGYPVVAELQDTYSGASPIAERPKGKEVVAMLKRREADALIVYCVDRLSRKLRDLLGDVDDWLDANIEVHACDTGRIESDNDIGLVFKGWQGTDERKKIRERTTNGKNKKAGVGGMVVGTGKPPYGYAYLLEKPSGYRRPKIIGFVIAKHEAKIVRHIYQWYTAGDEVGRPLTAYAIARRLTDMRIPAPSETRCKVRTRQSGAWCQATIHNILANETYAGVWYYGKRIGKHGRKGRRPKEQQYRVNVPAIIQRQVWEAAQARRTSNKLMATRNARRTYLLRGMVRCTQCKLKMTGRSQWEHAYYACAHKRSRFAGLEECCRQKSVRADILEPIVWNYILDLWRDKGRFEQTLRAAQRAELDSLQPKRERLATVQALLTDCECEAEDTAQALKRARGVILQKLERDAEEINERHAALSHERDELLLALDTRQLTDERIAAALKYRENVLVGLQAATDEDRRQDLEILQIEVAVTGDKARVQCVVPGTDQTFDINTSKSAAGFRTPRPCL